MPDVRFLLLQIRNPDDPMRAAEVASFARALEVDRAQIETCDLLAAFPDREHWAAFDAVLVGGSGHYSAVATSEPWLDRALEGFADLCHSGRPVFASCWGFQAIARALGGAVIHDKSRAEVGTLDVNLTPEGRADPVVGGSGESFPAQMGHTDHVVELPPGATRLAFSAPHAHQAYRLEGLPVYCTQFHAELSREDLVARVRQYPEYIRDTTGVSIDAFCASLRETPTTESLLRRFRETYCVTSTCGRAP